MDFLSLDLPDLVMQGIRDAGFSEATPIQEAALPLALKGKDVAGQSQTGTGKTAAFLIAAFTRMLRAPDPGPAATSSPRMLIIAPTRELVVQIEADARLLGTFTPFKIVAVYGGIDYGKQRDTLAAGCDVLVGTPGRLIDYLKQHVWSPRRVEVLVVDEADRMFDMGFIADLRFILRRLPTPEKRQSFLFSATLSFRVLELTWEFMNNPAQITIMPQQKTAERVEQALFHVGREEKVSLLLGLLRREGGERILIFSNTREEARRLEDRLSRNGWPARALTGDVEQRKRLKILNDFKEGTLPVLVASDVASRGLHIEAVSHVINWDLPQDPEDYVHRIGRTARAGAGGKAISLVDEASALNLGAIEKFLGQKIPVEWADDDLYVPEIKPSAEERRRYADERRARMEARGGRGDRGRRPGPGGGRRDGRRDGARGAGGRGDGSRGDGRGDASSRATHAHAEPRASEPGHPRRDPIPRVDTENAERPRRERGETASRPAERTPPAEPRVRFETVSASELPRAHPAPDRSRDDDDRQPRRSSSAGDPPRAHGAPPAAHAASPAGGDGGSEQQRRRRRRRRRGGRKSGPRPDGGQAPGVDQPEGPVLP